ncbi:hypothetical protein H4R20_001404 [Coemansia guatemalensis]|uniref:Uncharacterized protein n=1 Tax=Coemansia guatemalensis TaxID=2761395 RepID=A0A9W8LUY7_9FUNG|nr:hypothetical protein H4R20_001404 [Coemansia guatemalensis]
MPSNNNNPRNLPDELLSGNHPPRRVYVLPGRSEPNTLVPREYDASDGARSSVSAGAEDAQHVAGSPHSAEEVAHLQQENARSRQEINHLRAFFATVPMRARPAEQETFVTACPHGRDTMQEQSDLRLDESTEPGVMIRPYPNPVPLFTPRPRGQTTHVSTHGLYAALSPVTGGVGVTDATSEYLHGTPSYAHLDEVPGAYPRAATGHQAGAPPVRGCADSQPSVHAGHLGDIGEVAEFLNTPEVCQAYDQWCIERGEVNLHRQEQGASHEPDHATRGQPNYGDGSELRPPRNERQDQPPVPTIRNAGGATTWDLDRVFAASTACVQNLTHQPAQQPSRHTRFNGPRFVQEETPEVFAEEHSAPLPRQRATYTIATPMTIQTRAYIRPAPVTPGERQQRLPDKLPQFELGGDLYDYLMDLATTVQAHGLDLDIWGAQAVMASVDMFYRGVLVPHLHVKPSLTWKEVCNIVWDLIKPLVAPEIARCQLAEGRMDIYRPFLVFTQVFKKMRMLAAISKDSEEARSYFLGSLDQVVKGMLLSQFPLWVRDSDLDAGYEFVNKVDTTVGDNSSG